MVNEKRKIRIGSTIEYDGEERKVTGILDKNASIASEDIVMFLDGVKHGVVMQDCDAIELTEKHLKSLFFEKDTDYSLPMYYYKKLYVEFGEVIKVFRSNRFIITIKYLHEIENLIIDITE